MKGHKAFGALVLAGAVASLPLRQAHAGDQYQCSIIPETGQTENLPTTTFPKAGKLKIKPSKKAGDGGITMQLTLKDVTCGSKCQNNVLAMGTRALGTDSDNVVGLLFNITGGKALWPNGKNKTGFGTTFGPLASLIFNQSLGIGVITLHETASDPSACSTVLFGANQCTDGASYAVAGINVPVDPDAMCDIDADCGLITSVCNTTTHLCEQQTCSSDQDCNSGFCNINSNQCCSPDVGQGCP
jgi:hypothetical protein